MGVSYNRAWLMNCVRAHPKPSPVRSSTRPRCACSPRCANGASSRGTTFAAPDSLARKLDGQPDERKYQSHPGVRRTSAGGLREARKESCQQMDGNHS